MLIAFLIRHGESQDCTTRLVGRTPGIGLTARGREQARALPARLRSYVTSLDALYVSPLQRAMESAGPIAHAFGVLPQYISAFTEVDFGIWTGMSFDALERDHQWCSYNAKRSAALVPSGETAPALRERVLGALDEIRARHTWGTIAIITHAEVIRVVALECYGRSLDEFETVPVEPASITAVHFGGRAPRVWFANAC